METQNIKKTRNTPNNIISAFNEKFIEESPNLEIFHQIRTEDTVKVMYNIDQNNKKMRAFVGTVISKTHKGIMSSIHLLQPHADADQRITRTFFVFSPFVKIAEIMNHDKRRPNRSKSYYLQRIYGKLFSKYVRKNKRKLTVQ